MTRDFYGGCVKLNIPVTRDMQVTKFLVDDAEVGEWTLQVMLVPLQSDCLTAPVCVASDCGIVKSAGFVLATSHNGNALRICSCQAAHAIGLIGSEALMVAQVCDDQTGCMCQCAIMLQQPTQTSGLTSF